MGITKILIFGLSIILIVVVAMIVIRLVRAPASPAIVTPDAAPVSSDQTELDLALQTHFPDLWAEFDEQSREAKLDLYTMAGDLLHSLSTDVAAAPDHAIVDLIKAHAALARHLSTEDVEACAQFTAYGPYEVETYSPAARDRLHRLGALTIIAAKQGELTPTPRTITLREAVDQLQAAMKANGVPEDSLIIDLDNPPPDEDLCAHTLRTFETLLRLPPAQAAEIFVGMNYLTD